MTERTYTTVDKTAWPDGPWQHEPDKMQWVDEATGYDCLIVRAPMGALCGYVGVPPEHSCHGEDYYDIQGVDVHGGLTYADSCDEGSPEATGICHIPLPGRPDGVWWFGFDCAHAFDFAPRSPLPPFGNETYRTVEYVRREVAGLARQLVDAKVSTENRWED